MFEAKKNSNLNQYVLFGGKGRALNNRIQIQILFRGKESIERSSKSDKTMIKKKSYENFSYRKVRTLPLSSTIYYLQQHTVEDSGKQR